MPLYKHQADEVTNHTFAPARFLIHDPRTGKTRIILEEVKLWPRGSRVLVVCPKSAGVSWVDESNLVGVKIVNAIEGTMPQRERAISTADFLAREWPLVVVVNYDVLRKLEATILRYFLPTAIVFDESQYIKTPGAKRTRCAQRIALHAKYKRCLTGTPIDKSYRDIFSQCKALDPRIFGTKVRDFEDRYVIYDPFILGKVKGYRNLDELHAKLSAVASRVAYSDVHELPPIREITRRVFLPQKVQKLYDDLKRDKTAQFEGERFMTPHIFQQLTRAQQLTAGLLKVNDEHKWVHKEKIHAVLSEVQSTVDAGQKAVVFYHYVEEGRELENQITSSGVSCLLLGGHSSLQDRRDAIHAFDAQADPRVLVVQQDALGIGTNLGRASVAVFVSPGFDYIKHKQARDRILTPREPISYVYITAPGTIDETVLKALSTKKSISDVLFKSLTLQEALSGA